MSKSRVVIIGGGFAGMAAAKNLATADCEITVIDRNNHHLFQPLLYQVATAGLTPANIAYPIRSVMQNHKNIRTIMANVTGINPDQQTVEIDSLETLKFDYLVLAAGATHSYFGHDSWAKRAPGLKTVEDATEIRRRILVSFEKAERERDPIIRARHLTFVIIGAGPTGVELAGAIAELARRSISGDFRNIDPRSARIILLEAGDSILTSFSPKLSKKAEAALVKLGVEIQLEKRVTDIDEHHVICGTETISASTVIWAAGVQASELGLLVTIECDSAGRVKVRSDLSVPKHPNIFVAGDLARVPKKQSSTGGAALTNEALVPGVAPAAIQGGLHVAKNIRLLIAQKKTKAFRYLDKGQLATIGRNAAIAEFGPLKISGYFAWLTWVAVHIFFLIDFRNRMMVMIDWVLAYVTFRKGARLITGQKAESLVMVTSEGAGSPKKNDTFTVVQILAAETRYLRQQVLRPGAPMDQLSYPGDESETSVHFGMKNAKGDLVGIASIYNSPQPGFTDSMGWRLRGMATAAEVRGLGLGSKLLEACKSHISNSGGTYLWCNARVSALKFYKKNSFKTIGDEFDIPGIGPHFVMRQDY